MKADLLIAGDLPPCRKGQRIEWGIVAGVGRRVRRSLMAMSTLGVHEECVDPRRLA
ncbi:unnamed protein product [Brassica rapa]|uniref:Uncharacterized protein n=1 Tax=Brassica campestris TaxID=3711 RepID=A0A8D9D0Q1_BRACM|nr:unnamed protein product [Brassica rapa]CAG7908981.1 unnamed protein product [Brassica rapa]